jgi:NADH-quinone oxidoreductase subunit M
MLGIAAFTTTAVVGSVYQMLNHGISTGALFFLVGMLYERRHTREIAEFGGLKAVMPRFAAVFMLVGLSSMAVPGFNGFVGEFLILIGSWPALPVLTAVAVAGVVLAAAYLLWMIQRVFHGEVTNRKNEKLKDLTPLEAVVLVPLVVMAIVMGIASPMFTRTIEPTVAKLVHDVGERQRAAVGDPATRVAWERGARPAGGDAEPRPTAVERGRR